MCINILFKDVRLSDFGTVEQVEQIEKQWTNRQRKAPTHSSATEACKAIYTSCKYGGEKNSLKDKKRHRPCDSSVTLVFSTALTWLQLLCFPKRTPSHPAPSGSVDVLCVCVSVSETTTQHVTVTLSLNSQWHSEVSKWSHYFLMRLLWHSGDPAVVIVLALPSHHAVYCSWFVLHGTMHSSNKCLDI